MYGKLKTRHIQNTLILKAGVRSRRRESNMLQFHLPSTELIRQTLSLLLLHHLTVYEGNDKENLWAASYWKELIIEILGIVTERLKESFFNKED